MAFENALGLGGPFAFIPEIIIIFTKSYEMGHLKGYKFQKSLTLDCHLPKHPEMGQSILPKFDAYFLF